MTSGPLAGVRLIEMDAIGPVPLCGMVLSALGAEILRISRPGGQPVWTDIGNAVVLRGRTNLELNLKREADRTTFLKFVEHSDGLMEGGRPGVMERLGVGPDVCLAANPRLIYGRMTGWGQEGPLRMTAGHDINYIAMTGALHAIAQKGASPTVPLNLIGDYAGGTMFLAMGMLSALISARATGKGQVVDVAIVDGVVNLLGMFHAYLATGTWNDAPACNILDGAAPFYRCYECKDGKFIAVGALEPQFFALLLSGLNIPADRFDQNDISHWPAMTDLFAETFRTATRDHWEAKFAGTDACVSPVLSLLEAMDHPSNQARGLFVRQSGVRQAAPAPRFSQTPAAIAANHTTTAKEMLERWQIR